MARTYAGGTDQIHWYDNSETAVVSIGCVAFWMKTTQVTANVGVASHWSSSSRRNWGCVLNNVANKLSLVAYDTSTLRVNLVSTTSVNDGNWWHVCFNYNKNNGGANTLYINGTQEATANSSAAWTAGANSYYFTTGDLFDAFWASYVGSLAEIANWRDVNLGADDITALASGFSPLRVRPRYLDLYAPMVDSAVNNIEPSHAAPAGTFSVTGTTVSDHPRIIGGRA